jgi:hypothetical protein
VVVHRRGHARHRRQLAVPGGGDDAAAAVARRRAVAGARGGAEGDEAEPQVDDRVARVAGLRPRVEPGVQLAVRAETRVALDVLRRGRGEGPAYWLSEG